MPCLALVAPSEPCEIETEGDDEDCVEPLEEEEVDGAGAGAAGCDTGADAAAVAVGVTEATAGAGDEARPDW